jgi:hypothetical protein
MRMNDDPEWLKKMAALEDENPPPFGTFDALDGWTDMQLTREGEIAREKMIAHREIEERVHYWRTKGEDMLPPELRPRGKTWLHERENWCDEVMRLRAHIAKLEGRGNG